MKPNVALLISIASASVAVGIVSVDLAYTITSHIDVREGSGWATVASDPYENSNDYARFGPGCVAPDLRVRVDNNRPIPASVDVVVRYYVPEKMATPTEVYKETWSLAAFEEKTHEFVIPASAFPAATSNNPTPQLQVEAFLAGDYQLSVCVTRGS